MNWELIGHIAKILCAIYMTYLFISMMHDVEKLKNRADYCDEKLLRLKKKLKKKKE